MKLNLGKATALLTAAAMGAIPVAAQQRSHSAQITLVAKMPETMGFAVNNGEPDDSTISASRESMPPPAHSLTTMWTLGKGRSRIAISARIKWQDAPIVLAFAAQPGIGADDGRASDFVSGFQLRKHPAESNIQFDSFAITNSNLASSSTISLSDSVRYAPASGFAENECSGTIKIQVHALP